MEGSERYSNFQEEGQSLRTWKLETSQPGADPEFSGGG